MADNSASDDVPGRQIPGGKSTNANPSQPAGPATVAPTTPAAQARNPLAKNVVALASPSPSSSPRTSRTTSPVRRENRVESLPQAIQTQPSAAAIQRALSAANTSQLQQGQTQDAASRLPRPARSGEASGDSTPHWPTSPRLKSPPPSTSSSRRGSSNATRKIDTASAPSISVQSATPQSIAPTATKTTAEEGPKISQLQSPAKAPSRGPSGKPTLETVQENSTHDTKDSTLAGTIADTDLKPLTKHLDNETPAKKPQTTAPEEEKQIATGGNDDASATPKRDVKRDEGKKDEPNSTQKPRAPHTKSYASTGSMKSREGKQNMTVETETVPSIPQSALSAGDRTTGRTENSGSVRLKPSSETLRPKKERRKPYKARSINQSTSTSYLCESSPRTQQAHCEESHNNSHGSSPAPSTVGERFSGKVDSPHPERHFSYSHKLQLHLSLRRPTRYVRTLSNRLLRKASSKADIFEKRVADAVDEANDSDSEETFVYESNPPEPQQRPRHHSRTPSVTSSHSVADQQRSGVRSFGEALDDRKVAGKRSMKFSNNAYLDTESPDSKDGSIRSHRPRHFGRFGRGGNQINDPDSPFTQASKLRSNQYYSRTSRPNSPRSPQSGQQYRKSGLLGKKQDSSFDFDAEGGDDERMPLIGTVRTQRSRGARRIGSSESIDEYYGVRRRPRCGGCGSCTMLIILVAAITLSTAAFLVMSNRPMYEVNIQEVQNVLASEQEIMLDLLVGAVNPNALGIAVTDMDVNMFAKSKHVGSGEFWRHHSHAPLTTSPAQRSRRRRSPKTPVVLPSEVPDALQDLSHHWITPSDGVDEGTDPDDDLEHDAQTMLLGRIFHFDQGLSFEGSPLKRHPHLSIGELRLTKPGNKTETGGSERWEKVLQYPFELIIRGVLKYDLPISGRLQTSAVEARVVVHPEGGVDGDGNVRIEMGDV